MKVIHYETITAGSFDIQVSGLQRKNSSVSAIFEGINSCSNSKVREGVDVKIQHFSNPEK